MFAKQNVGEVCKTKSEFVGEMLPKQIVGGVSKLSHE
jgi:hypothetical protein